jgi:hypothetical protein
MLPGACPEATKARMTMKDIILNSVFNSKKAVLFSTAFLTL